MRPIAVAERNTEKTRRFRIPISVIRRMLTNKKVGPIIIVPTKGIAKAGFALNTLSKCNQTSAKKHSARRNDTPPPDNTCVGPG